MKVLKAFTFLLLPLSTLIVAESAARFNIMDAVFDTAAAKTQEISTAELKDILARNEAVVLDTRPHLEWAISHIPGARNVSQKPTSSIALYISDVKEVSRLLANDAAKQLVLYCNGPFCGKSKRLSEELIAAGYKDVRRYQLGIPVWRALGGLTVIEPEGVRYVFEADKTAVFLDARDEAEFSKGSIPGAKNIPAARLSGEKDVGLIKDAKEDGRLPMNDHNTRIVVFGESEAQAKKLAEAVTQEAFHNVAYFSEGHRQLRQAISK